MHSEEMLGHVLAIFPQEITYHQAASHYRSRTPASYHLAGIDGPPMESISGPICSHCQMLSRPPHRRKRQLPFTLSLAPHCGAALSASLLAVLTAVWKKHEEA